MRRPGDKTAGDVQWHDTLIRQCLNFKPSSAHSTVSSDYEHVGRCEQCHRFQSGFQICFFTSRKSLKKTSVVTTVTGLLLVFILGLSKPLLPFLGKDFYIPQ